MLVLVDLDRTGFAARNFDGHDLFGEVAAGGGLAGALLRAQRECVLILALDLKLLGDVLARFRHGIDAVLRFEHRIDEPPADGGVVNLRAARKRFAGLAHDKGRARHGFDAAGDGEIHLAGADRARRIADRIEPGSAKPIDGEAGHAFRQSGEQQRHARHVAIVFAGLVGAAEENFVETRPIGLRVARDECADRRGGEIVGADFRQRAAVAADGGARCIADENIPHCSLLVPLTCPCQVLGGRAGSVKRPQPRPNSTRDLTAFGSNVRRKATLTSS